MRVPLDIRPLTGSLGAEIHGLELRKPLDRETVEALEQALVDHLVIFFPKQDLSPEEHIAFGRHFGELFTDHPAYLPTLEGYPEMVVLSSDSYGQVDIWHTDITISERPPMGSILHMQVCPEYGGDTMWANMYAAYDALSPRMQRYLEGLVAVHDLAGTFRTVLREKSGGIQAPAGGIPRQLPSAEHPVVRTHPATGRKALFVNPTFTSHIKDLPPAEGDALLAFLYRHSVQPEFLCRRRWSEGDVGFWDNRCTMHYAVADYGKAKRVIHRVTIQGERPV